MFNVKDILTATNGKLLSGRLETKFSYVSTDTRAIKQGALFVAIKGPNFDGHNYISEARSKGAVGAIVDKGTNCHACESRHPGASFLDSRIRGNDKVGGVADDFTLIEVSDTVKALGDIAAFHRKKFDIPVICVTGSNGKTTTKEMIFAILSKKYQVLKNEGTENNFIGVPLTLLRLNAACEIAVLELGSNHPGEIARLSEIAGPTCAVITNIGSSHLEFFNTLDNVRREKLSLLRHLGSDGLSVVNGDDAELAKNAGSMRAEVVTFGLGAGCEFRAQDIKESASGIDFTLTPAHKFHLNLLGRHNVYNALAAIAVGSQYGISFEDAAVLKDFKPPKFRMEVFEAGGVRFIFDCYNSNPSSMAGALEALKGMNISGRKILVAGDMLELGQAGPDLHKEIGRLAAGAKVDIIMGVGALSKFILEGARQSGIENNRLSHFENCTFTIKALKDILRDGDLVLVKGSRGMKMEEIKNCFITSCIP